MSIQTRCPKCKTHLSVAKERSGKDVRCPSCDAVFRVPEPNSDRHDDLHKNNAPKWEGTDESDDNGSVPSENEKALVDQEVIEKWYLRIPEGNVYGPVNQLEFENWIEEGRVSADCRLRRESDMEWSLATDEYPVLAMEGNPFSEVTPYTPKAENLIPHRGAMIFALSIAGCVVPFVSFWPAVMGTRDLHRMNQGKLDPSGDALTRAGQAIAMISSMIWISAFAIGLLVLLIQTMNRI